MTVEVYVFEDANGAPDTYTTMNPIEAREYASRNGRRMVAQIFEYSDSEVVADFTGDEDEE